MLVKAGKHPDNQVTILFIFYQYDVGIIGRMSSIITFLGLGKYRNHDCHVFNVLVSLIRDSTGYSQSVHEKLILTVENIN
jgi:hypothetical protein